MLIFHNKTISLANVVTNLIKLYLNILNNINSGGHRYRTVFNLSIYTKSVLPSLMLAAVRYVKPEEGIPEDPGELPVFFMGSAQTHLSVPYEDKLNSRTASSPNWYSSGVNCTVWFGSALLKKRAKIIYTSS